MKKTHYMATLPDATIPDSVTAGTPVNLADHVGKTIDHPNPCKHKWHDESHFSYFRTYTRPGEVLETLNREDEWPVRLWIVEPVGEVGNWSPREHPYWVLAHQLRIVEEAEPWQALGHRGRQTLDLITHEIPERARRWAADWSADPDGTRERRQEWYRTGLCRRNHCEKGEYALLCTRQRARSSRREAALRVTRNLAGAAAGEAAADIGDDEAIAYASHRAQHLAAAALFADRLDTYVLKGLRGTDLDQPHTPAAPARA